MSDNYPAGVTEGDFQDKDGGAFQNWYFMNEDRLVSQFLDLIGDDVPVKDWDTATKVKFDDFVLSEYEKVREYE